jgi:hypothetical protein
MRRPTEKREVGLFFSSPGVKGAVVLSRAGSTSGSGVASFRGQDAGFRERHCHRSDAFGDLRSAVLNAKLVVAARLGSSLALVLLVVTFAVNPAAAATCSGERVYPSQDLAAVAREHPAGTTFCITDSTSSYEVNNRIVVEDEDRFVGVYSDGTRVGVETTNADHVFYTRGADNAFISGLRIQGAVHDNWCEPECGRGIGGGGKNLTVEDVRATYNENQGIGGTGPGLMVRDSEFDHNGSQDAAMDGGKVSAAGIKSVNSMRVHNSYFHDNYLTGVWCDLECGRFEVRDSVLLRNGKAGIHDEVSSGPAVFEGNTIQRNGGAPGADTRVGGILIVGSSNVDAFGNAFGGNHGSAVEVAGDPRTGYLTKGVQIRDNELNGDALEGYAPGGNSCMRLWIFVVCRPFAVHWGLMATNALVPS